MIFTKHGLQLVKKTVKSSNFREFQIEKDESLVIFA